MKYLSHSHFKKKCFFLLFPFFGTLLFFLLWKETSLTVILFVGGLSLFFLPFLFLRQEQRYLIAVITLRHFAEEDPQLLIHAIHQWQKQLNKEQITEKLVYLLSAIGSKGTEKLLSHFNSKEKRKLAKAVDQITTITLSQKRKIALEFSPYFDMLIDQSCSNSLKKLFPKRSKKRPTPYQIGDKKLLRILQTAPEEKLAAFFEAKPPNTTSLMLSHLNKERASKILSQFSQEKQGEILHAFSNWNEVEPEQLYSTIKAAEKILGISVFQEKNIPDQLAQIGTALRQNL